MEISCLTLLDFFKFDRMRKGFEIHFFDISIGLIKEIGFFSAMKAQARQQNLKNRKLDKFVKKSSLGPIFCTMSHKSVRMKSNVMNKQQTESEQKVGAGFILTS